MMQYLFARGWAERNGYELRHDHFIGEDVFDLGPVLRPESTPNYRCNEDELTRMAPNGCHFEFRGYAMKQPCMTYTKRQAQSWLKFRSDLRDKFVPWEFAVAAHRRIGDFMGYDGYPIVSEQSIRNAQRYYGLMDAAIITEESPIREPELPDHLSFLPDFCALTFAHTLLRGNSSFSWVAALLSDGLILSPVISGLEGKREHDVKYVPGNYPRLSDHDFVSDLHVAP